MPCFVSALGKDFHSRFYVETNDGTEFFNAIFVFSG